MENCNGKHVCNGIYNKCNTLMSSVPLPPPPPPPLPIIPQKHKQETPNNAPKPSPNDEVRTSLSKYNLYFSSKKVVSFYKPIHSIIQEGPSCGIVALSMASQLLDSTDVTDLLEAAVEFGFSKSGEIFSAYNMSSLASSKLNCDATVISDLKLNVKSILSHICNGWPVLMPYDADKNHEPCFNNGRSAHWAVVSGLCFEVTGSLDFLNECKSEVISCGLKVYFDTSGQCVEKLSKFASKIFVYARQGKSRHLAVWDLDLLLSSNSNLFEVTDKYGLDALVLPYGDCLSELRNKAVLIKKK